MSELQSADGVNDDINQTDLSADLGQGAELAPASEENHEEKTDNQDAINKAIDRQHKKYRDEERLRLAAEEENEKLRQQLEQYKPQQVELPQRPDPFDDDFEAKQKAYEDAIAQNARLAAEQEIISRQQQEQQALEQQKAQAELDNQVKVYSERAVKLGIKPEELQQAGNTIAQYGMHQEIVTEILKDPEGALITKYLADRPEELINLQSMPPLQAMLHIERNVRVKASELRPKESNATPPPTQLSGGKATKPDEAGLASGGSFE